MAPIGLAQNPVSRVLTWIGVSLHLLPSTAEGKQDLECVLRNEGPCWWERLWTVQEVALSADLPDIYFGPYVLKWREFLSLLDPIARQCSFMETSERLHSELGTIDKQAPDMDTKILYIKAMKLRHRLLELEQLRETDWRKQSTNLLDLAHLNLGSAVTDPKDRVYSLLGLVHREEAEMISVEYDKIISAQQVFAKATFNMMKRDRSLSVLEYVSASTSHDPAMPTWAIDFAMPTISWVNIVGSRLNPQDLQNPEYKSKAEAHLSADCKMLITKATFYDYVYAVYPLGSEQNSPLFEASGSTWPMEVGRRSNGSQYWIGFEAKINNFVWEYHPSFLRPMSATALRMEGGRLRSDLCSTSDVTLDRIFDNWVRFSAGLVMPEYASLNTRVSAYWWNHLRRGQIRSHDAAGVYPSFYVTRRGHIGIGPPDVQQNDVVAGLNGAPSFSLIRRLSGMRFAFKGFTYISINHRAGTWPKMWSERADPIEETINLV
ncbi:MAG: hypothetical protein M1822_009148 [Bathelium mastoideum]|nr:MAG: hypothetical protein M1822_009148 [Bathelium mastoideum]